MFSTLGIVQACGGAPFSKAAAARKLGGKSLLEWVIRRVTDSQRLDGVLVVLPDTEEQHPLVELVPPDVPLFIGQRQDPLGLFVAALEEYPAQNVVRIRADSPFIDPVLIDRLATTGEEHPHCDYISYCSGDGRRAVMSSVGLFAEWCSASALRQADQEAVQPEDREHFTRYLYSRPERFNIRLIPAPAGLDREDVRLTINSEQDWEHAQTVLDALGPEALDWQRIAGLLDEHPALRKQMAVLNRGLC